MKEMEARSSTLKDCGGGSEGATLLVYAREMRRDTLLRVRTKSSWAAALILL